MDRQAIRAPLELREAGQLIIRKEDLASDGHACGRANCVALCRGMASTPPLVPVSQVIFPCWRILTLETESILIGWVTFRVFFFFGGGDALKFGPLCASASQNMLSYGEGRLELNNGCTGICLNDKCVIQLPHLVGVGSCLEAHAHRTP